ncbi:hypothetical protein UMC2_08291 [[Clostridium] sordellii]|uniref:hypothetical protein n=1 Tax=Paraclostridium sordellii TaxID=1505 RepID=UPI0005423E53|nr:hypothetical protein [Paeniclostridium sordellii]CEK33579.1 hypothetical protein UMC2_08291 [[Clostridium] sordellii] [Paeniclostridium sordellii]
MITKSIVILRNFSHVPTGSYVRGEHHRINEDLANKFIKANLAAPCNHTHVEENEGIVDVPDYINAESKSKTRGRRKKADENGNK